MTVEVAGHKVGDWVFYIGGGVAVLAIWYFLSNQGGGSGSVGSSAASQIPAYNPAIAAAAAQEQAQQMQYSLGEQKQQMQYGLEEQKLGLEAAQLKYKANIYLEKQS